MDASTLKLYRDNRSKYPGIPASVALHWARSQERTAEVEWDWNGDKAEIEQDGFTVRLTIEPDYYPDTSWLGEFSDTWKPGAITNERHDSRLYRWFIPANTAASHRADLSRLGYSRSVAEDLARGYVLRDLQTFRDYQSYIVTVTAYWEEIELATDSLGGVDISPNEDSQAQFESIADDHGMIDTVLTEARETISRLITANLGA